MDSDDDFVEVTANISNIFPGISITAKKTWKNFLVHRKSNFDSEPVLTSVQRLLVSDLAKSARSSLSAGTPEGLYLAARRLTAATELLPRHYVQESIRLVHAAHDIYDRYRRSNDIDSPYREATTQSIVTLSFEVEDFAAKHVSRFDRQKIIQAISHDYDSIIPPFVSLEGVYINKNKQSILNNITVRFPTGKISGIVGPNGAGKSTLLDVISMRSRPYKGTLRFPFYGKLDDPKVTLTSCMDSILYCKQEPSWFDGSVVESLTAWAAFCGTTSAHPERIERAIALMGLLDYRLSKCSELSAGYRTRFDLARCLLSSPGAILLDEPLSHLDPTARRLYLDELRHILISYPHTTIIITSHDIDEIDRIADFIVCLENGSVQFSGMPDQISSYYNHSLYEIMGSLSDEARRYIVYEYDGIIDDADILHGSIRIEIPQSIDRQTLLKLLINTDCNIEKFIDLSSSVLRLLDIDYSTASL